MIKGVNKQIVEINYTKNDYIEKAILIIKPEKSKLPKAFLTQKADSYMQSLLPKSTKYQVPLHRKKIFLPVIGILIAILSILIVLFLLLI